MARYMTVAGFRFRAICGAAAVEFAIVIIPLLMLILGVMEFGRLMYLWSTVQEVTRNAARQAVVTNFKDDVKLLEIKNSAVFRAAAGALPGGPEITNARVVIRYLNSAGDELGAGGASPSLPDDPADNVAACLSDDPILSVHCIRYVEVCVSTGSTCSPAELVSFVPVIGLFSQDTSWGADLTGLKIPLSTVRMPAESLGFKPDS